MNGIEWFSFLENLLNGCGHKNVYSHAYKNNETYDFDTLSIIEHRKLVLQ